MASQKFTEQQKVMNYDSMRTVEHSIMQSQSFSYYKTVASIKFSTLLTS